MPFMYRYTPATNMEPKIDCFSMIFPFPRGHVVSSRSFAGVYVPYMLVDLMLMIPSSTPTEP